MKLLVIAAILQLAAALFTTIKNQGRSTLTSLEIKLEGKITTTVISHIALIHPCNTTSTTLSGYSDGHRHIHINVTR